MWPSPTDKHGSHLAGFLLVEREISFNQRSYLKISACSCKDAFTFGISRILAETLDHEGKVEEEEDEEAEEEEEEDEGKVENKV